MIKIKIIGKDGYNWSIDKDNKNVYLFLNKCKNLKICSSYLFSDVYFFVWYNALLKKKYFFIKIFKKLLNKKILAVITNDIRNYPLRFNKLSSLVDLWISPNKKISKYLSDNKVPYIQIPFYVSPEKFKKLNLGKKELSQKLNINYDIIKNKILIGSFQRDSLGKDLTKPKWQKNPDLLIRICKEIPKDKFILILAGPRRHYVINQCKKYNIPYIFIGDEQLIKENKDDFFKNNLSEEIINLLYNLIDIYIVSSKIEGGPKAILEASLTKTLILSTDVGLARDFIHPDLIYKENNIDIIKNFIQNLKENQNKINKYIKFNYQNTLNKLNEKNYIQSYKKILGKIK